MRRLFIFFALALWTAIAFASLGDQPNGKTKEIIIHHTTDHQSPHMIDVLPTSFYYETTRMLTIEFPTTGFEPYTLSVESMYNTLDYYVTTPFTSVYISPDVVDVNLYLETDGGDLYWGSFEATAAGSME